MSDPHRDEALEAAWRAQSQEQPPPSLDAAILAAARREVHARPEALGKSESTAQARKPPRAWWGFAAAATIGAIAFGVLQLAPREEPSSPAVASDVPTARAQEERVAPPVAAPAAAERAAPRDNEAPAPKLEKAPRAAARQAPAPQPPAPAAPPTTPDVPASPAPAPAPAPPMPNRTESAPAPAAATADAATPPHARAFPGETAREEKTAGTGTAETRARSASRSAQAPQSLGQAAAGARRDAAAPGASAPLALRAAVPPETWIARIEALMRAGRRDDAARELKAFRSAYADADARLPPALREWAASVPRD